MMCGVSFFIPKTLFGSKKVHAYSSYFLRIVVQKVAKGGVTV